MQLQLNAIDVFKAAIKLEDRGAAFYAIAADKACEQSRKLLLQLSEMEKGHAQKFSEVLGALTEVTAASEEPEDLDGFLQALTSDRIITQECHVLATDRYEAILEKAMLIEKNSVFFYTAVKDIMQAKMSAGAVEKIIREEIGHFKMLNEALLKWRKRGSAL